MKTVALETARELIDFGTRIDSAQRADEQLRGAVALHNLLVSHRCAYLADEVGMGKTYVALGVLGLMQHFHPKLRVLVIAPRENIQSKWMKELSNFVQHNVRFPDLRVRALDGRPAAPMVKCDNLLDLVHQANLRPHGIFFARMTSFSVGLSRSDEGGGGAVRRDRQRLRDELKKHLPWLGSEVLDLRGRDAQEFKDNFARALCCAMPAFDLVIVDEAHNLKHGFKDHAAARNRVMALAFGHPNSGATQNRYPGYGRRAGRVLFLSATPIEETYSHLYNQLDIFGLGEPFIGLTDRDLNDDVKKALAKRFLIRRVTSMNLGSDELTKNLYRREWRRGGVETHDEPIRVTDPRERLVLALVQKKVAEAIGHPRFGAKFQMGMLASFESFQETALPKQVEGQNDFGNFDDADQTRDGREREGVDVRGINRLALTYRREFGRELPHPKMDALVERLSHSWETGEKALVFVRRIASVIDLKRKLDERYDMWLIERMKQELPTPVISRFNQILEQYRQENLSFRNRSSRGIDGAGASTGNNEDEGGKETFFAWFFRGKGPEKVFSGAALSKQFTAKGSIYATFFEDNHTAAVLGCSASGTLTALAEAVGKSESAVRTELVERARRFLSSKARKLTRADAFAAIQSAALEWLSQSDHPVRDTAALVFHERSGTSPAQIASSAPELTPASADWLNLPTFFTELRRADRSELRERLWPTPPPGDAGATYRETAIRAELLGSAARLGHGFIDFYLRTIARSQSLELRGQAVDTDDSDEEDSAPRRRGDFAEDRRRIEDFLDLLEEQRRTPLEKRGWRAFDELADIATNFDLISDVNLSDSRDAALGNLRQEIGSRLLGSQRPVGSMHGSVNGTLVKQFRMPGYPLVLVSTDLLQEGEDLHTFCSVVHHYGLSWTPSSMEQRTGRIDRVRSHTERRLLSMKSAAEAHKLQVYFPHLEDTVEVLQVRRLLTRMNTFLQLMHEGLHIPESDDRSVNVSEEILRHHEPVPAFTKRLHTAFPVRPQDLEGQIGELARTPAAAEEMVKRFQALREIRGTEFTFELTEPGEAGRGRLFGSIRLGDRVQPFGLYLQSFGEHPLVRCISPVGRALSEYDLDHLQQQKELPPFRLGAIEEVKGDHSYDLTVEDDALLAAPAHDLQRVCDLIRRVAAAADDIEKSLLEADEPLATFRSDLGNE
jgi:hypothetical protein